MLESGPQTRLDALTGLRYFAAMSVVLSHVANANADLDGSILSQLSAIGMPLFFSLSGFLMSYNYFAPFAERRPGTLRRYYVARFSRIYPVYLIVLLVSFSFMGNFFHDVTKRPDETYKCLAFTGTLTQSWVHLPAFTDFIHPRTITQAYLGVAWSVSTEVFFYATFPLTIPLLRRMTRPWMLLVAMTSIFFAYAAFDLWYFRDTRNIWRVATGFSFDRWLLYLSPYGRIGEFLMGCLTARLFDLSTSRDNASKAPKRNWWATPVILTCVTILFVYSRYIGEQLFAINELSLNVGLAPVCCLLLYCLVRYRTWVGRLLGSRLFVLLGECSYCLFLCHPLVQSFYYQRSTGEAAMNDWFLQTYNHVAMLFVMHLIALGLYRYVELPLRNHFRDLLNPAPPCTTIPIRDTLEAPRLAA